VTAIQAFDKAEDRRERSNGGATPPAELGEAGMTPLRRGLAVIARDEGDRFDFVGLEPAKIAVLDQIVRVFVMTFVADVNADVVEQRGIFQPLALPIGEPVNRARLIEERNRETRHLAGMFRPVVAAFTELDDAAPAHVGVAVGLGDLLAVPRDVIEHQAFAQRQIAQRDLARAEPSDDRVEQDGAGHREVRAARLEPRDAKAFLQIQRHEHLPDAVKLFGRNTPVPQRCVRG